MEMSSIYISIATSLIASVVFWIGFSVVPFLLRYFRIRPRVENDIMAIQLQLFFFVQIPFLQSIHTASDFQPDIKAKKIGKSDIKNALYGKCLSAECCKGEFEHRLLPVGEKLVKISNEIDKRIDRIQCYSVFLRTREILVLKEIRDRIHMYEYVEYKDIIDGKEFVPLNPTISYMSDNFYELLILYHKINAITDSYLLVKRNESEKYVAAKKDLDEGHLFAFFIRRFFLDKDYQMLLDIRYFFLHDRVKKARQSLRNYLSVKNERLVYLRGYLEDYLSESEFIGLLTNIRGDDEVQELISYINSEKNRKKKFELRNAENKALIDTKSKNAPKISDLDEDSIRIINKLFDGYL